MTTITAKVIADSVLSTGSRLTTLQLRYPRCIHSEFMTHRVFSRNASSSRAIPVRRLIQDILDDPFVPLHWGKNQKGMQADSEHAQAVNWYDHEGDLVPQAREDAWLSGLEQAAALARAFDEAGYHKQLVNRLLEPFAHINVVVTSSKWENFFELRDHPDAEPHFRILAQEIRRARDASHPVLLSLGEWHLPYISADWPHSVLDAVQCSVARCARVSYLTTEGKEPSISEDLALYGRLVGSEPLHASPAEHQACARVLSQSFVKDFDVSPLIADEVCGNFDHGWVQYRKILERVSSRLLAGVS